MLRIFGVPISQPVRAVVWPCLMKGLPFKLEMVAPYSAGKKGARNPEYRAMNPSGTVPAIDDNGFHMGESHAIMQYLAEKNKWLDLYPSEIQQRARVNMYLHYHHRNTREASAVLTGPMFNEKISVEPAVKERGVEILNNAISVLDEYWLAKSDYLVGESVTLADIAAYSELGQLLPRYANLHDFSGSKNVSAWMERMQGICSACVLDTRYLGLTRCMLVALPFHDEVHVALDVLGDLSTRNGETIPMEKMIEANKTAFKKLLSLAPSS